MSEDNGFARFSSMTECNLEMKKLGHTPEDCASICDGIKDRAEKGALLKAIPEGLQVVSKADEEDIVVYGYASYDCIDDDEDIFTVEAQVKALDRFMSQPPEYQLITFNHGRGNLGEIKVGQPLLKYTNSAGEKFYTHVNEKGTPFATKIRNDNLKSTQYIRELAKAGKLNGYSVNAVPLVRDPDNPHRVLDMEYTAITLTENGVFKPRNPMARDVKVLSKAEVPTPTLNSEKTLDAEELLQKYGFTHCH
jgi:hypothetical protein